MDNRDMQPMGHVLRLTALGAIAATAFWGAWLLGGYSRGILDLEALDYAIKLAEVDKAFEVLTAHLGSFESTHGRYPTNDEGVAVIAELDAILPGVACHYENRAGYDPATFADSPIRAGADARHTRRVAEEVYLYSYVGQIAADEADALWWADAWKRIAGGALLLLAGGIALWAIRRRGLGNAVAAMLLLLGSAVAGEKVNRYFPSSYEAALTTRPTYAHAPAQRKALLAKFRDRGVITQATYDRAMGPAQSPPATRPTQNP